MLIRWLKVSKQKELYNKIDQLQDQVLATLKENLQLLKDKEQLLDEVTKLKQIILETLDELTPDKIYGYVNESIYESCGSAGLSNDFEAYKGSGTHIPLYKLPRSILKVREVLTK